MSSLSSSSPAVDARVPLLASASGTGAGAPHALWRPQMQTFLMRHGIEERDYAEEIAQWRELAAVVQASARAEEQEAINVVLGVRAASSLSTPYDGALKKEEVKLPDEVKAKQRVAELIGRSRKAFGHLYSALPADLRPLVADVPQGYAFGIWSFLEKKFRSTEQDSVMALWERITTMRQEEEAYDVYKARVDSVVELLVHAKQALAPGLYASLLLWRLQPRYATAVLTLKTGELLKDPAAIDWPRIGEYMAQYERTQLGLGDTDSPGADRAMAARGKQSSSSGGSGSKPPSSTSAVDHSGIECFNCHKYGHYASRCPLPDRRSGGPASSQKGESQGQWQQQKSKKRGEAWSRRAASSATSSASDNSSDDEREGKASPRSSSRPTVAPGGHKVNAVRHLNRFNLLANADDDNDRGRWTGHRSYCARALVGLQPSARPPAAARAPASDADEPPRPVLKRLKRPEELRRAASGAEEKKRVRFGPKPEAKARESERRSPQRPSSPAVAKSLDVALRTTSKAIDSGATVSITGNKETLINVRRCTPMPIAMADKTVVSAVYKGDMPMRLPVAGKESKVISIVIRDVYYHERIDANLLSWGCMRLDGWQMHSTPDGTYVVTPKGSRINASTRGRLTILDDAGPERALAARMGRFVCQTAEELLLLHQRVGHASWGRLLKMCRAGATTGVGGVSSLSTAELKKAEGLVKQCDACVAGKLKRNALGHRGLDKGTEAGEVLHMDVFYTMMRNPQTRLKYREYCLLGTDAYCQLRWIAKTTSLHDLQAEVIQIIRRSTGVTGRSPRLVVCDLGSEFDNGKVKSYCNRKGIHLQETPARAKELNGVAEKSVDTVKNHVRAMLQACGMTEQMGWARAAFHHAYLWNRTHICSNTGVTPFEAVNAREPSILNVGVFGCDAFVHQDRTQRDTTFSAKAQPGIYLGHDYGQNCPIVYMLHSGKTLMVKDVMFREHSFKHLSAHTDGQVDQVESLDVAELNPSIDDEVAPRLGAEARPSMTTEQECKDDVDPSDAEDADADDADDESEEEKQPRRFEVKSITDQRTDAGGKVEYRVKWAGYPATTWEPAATMREDAPDAVKHFESFLAQRQEARVTRSRGAAPPQAPNASSSLASAHPPAAVIDSDDDSESQAIEAARFVAAKCL
jgi:hypothetical protein